MMVKSGLDFFILKFTEPLQRYLLTCQANLALLGRFFCTGQQQLWRGSVNFKIKSSRPLYTIILSQKCQFQDSRFQSTYKMRPSWCDLLKKTIRQVRWLSQKKIKFSLKIAKLYHFYYPVNAWWRNKYCIEINLLIINLLIKTWT